MPAAYRLSCCAPWTSDTLAAFCMLFQDKAVNIRRLVMAPVFHEPSLCNLELQFVVPDDAENDFVGQVRKALEDHACQRMELVTL